MISITVSIVWKLQEGTVIDRGASRKEKSGKEEESLWNAIAESMVNPASEALQGDLRSAAGWKSTFLQVAFPSWWSTLPFPSLLLLNIFLFLACTNQLFVYVGMV